MMWETVPMPIRKKRNDRMAVENDDTANAFSVSNLLRLMNRIAKKPMRTAGPKYPFVNVFAYFNKSMGVARLTNG